MAFRVVQIVRSEEDYNMATVDVQKKLVLVVSQGALEILLVIFRQDVAGRC